MKGAWISQSSRVIACPPRRVALRQTNVPQMSLMWLSAIGKWMVVGGLIIVAMGVLLFVLGKLSPSLGHLPGDIHVQKENSSFHFPWVTCLVVSAALTLLINIVLRLFKS